jgi:hypothetical protein
MLWLGAFFIACVGLVELLHHGLGDADAVGEDE